MKTLLPCKNEYISIAKGEKLILTEKFFSEYECKKDLMKNLSEELDIKLCELLGLLPSEAAARILDLLRVPKYKEVIEYNKNKYHNLVIFYHTLEFEKHFNGEFSIDSFNTIEDIIEIYRYIIIMTRRIEYDFELREQFELFIYLKQKKLSYMHLLSAIEYGTIYNKSKVYTKLSEYMGLRDEGEWKHFFYLWGQEHG